MIDKELFPINIEKEEAKDLKRILRHYTQYWYLFVLGSIVGLSGAYLYLRYYAVPMYRVSSTMLIKDDENGQGAPTESSFSDLAMFKSTKNIDNEIEVLKSKGLMQRVVRELDMVASYYVEGPVNDMEIYGNAVPVKLIVSELDSSATGKSFKVHLKANNLYEIKDILGNVTVHSSGQLVRMPYGTFTILTSPVNALKANEVIVRFSDMRKLATQYNPMVTYVNVKASVLNISLVGAIPEKSMKIVNKLIDIYNRESIEDKNSKSTNTLRFLDDRLKFITADLSVVERSVEKYKKSNGLADISTQASSYISQAGEYNKQLSEWAIQIELLGSIESYLDKSNGKYVLVPSNLGIQDATLLGLIEKYNGLQLEREQMLRTIEVENPLIQNMNALLESLRSNILENLRNIKRGLQITSNNLKNSSGQFQSKISRVPAMERELLEINRQQLIKNNIYSYLLQKREETALALAATASVARVIDPASREGSQISPNSQYIYLIALMLGLGLPFASIYTVSMLNTKVQTQQDVKDVLGLPILGEIANKPKGTETVVVTYGNRSPVAEMFRLVRANLNFIAVGKEVISFLVTSSTSGEGKTFFSINLAASLALTGKRVVLLDLDLRAPKVSKELNLGKGLGITDFLVSKDVTIDNIIRTSDKVADLFVISAGPVPPNPAELMMNTKFAHLVNELKERFDYIIFDTPPVGQVADALILSQFVDYSIYIVRYGYTDKSMLKIIKNLYNNKSLKHPIIVLNDAKEENGSNYGYGYGYGYGAQVSTVKR